MKYANLLKSYIKKSRYTLDELSTLLTERGISASREHLSRLQNGKVPPGSDELNKAIAEITGGDPEELIIAAYLEKAPEEFKKRIHINEQAKEHPKENEQEEVTDEELEKLLNHPEFGLWFKELKGSPEENRQKALDFLRWLNEQEKKDEQKKKTPRR